MISRNPLGAGITEVPSTPKSEVGFGERPVSAVESIISGSRAGAFATAQETLSGLETYKGLSVGRSHGPASAAK
jgi:hypothetical protein